MHIHAHASAAAERVN